MENELRHHHHHHHRSHIGRNLKLFLFIVILALLGGKLAVVISGFLTPSSGSGITGMTPEKKKEIINNYKDKYGDEWKKKLLEDYKNYTGK